MASVLSLLLATLVVGTIYNFVDVAVDRDRPFRPVHAMLENPLMWAASYGIALVAGAVALLLNVSLDPWLTLFIVGVVSFIIATLLILTDKTVKNKAKEFRNCFVGLVSFALVSGCTAAGTLWLLSLSGS